MKRKNLLWTLFGGLVLLVLLIRVAQYKNAYDLEDPEKIIEDAFSDTCLSARFTFPEPVYGEDTGWYARVFTSSEQVYVDLTVGVPLVVAGEQYFYCNYKQLTRVETYAYEYLRTPVNYWVVFDSRYGVPMIEGCKLLNSYGYVPTDIFNSEFKVSAEYICQK